MLNGTGLSISFCFFFLHRHSFVLDGPFKQLRFAFIHSHPHKHHLLRYIQPHFHVIRFGAWNHCWWCCFSKKKMSTGVYMRHYNTSKPLEASHNVLFFPYSVKPVSLLLSSSSTSTLTSIVLRAISLPSMESSWIESRAHTNVSYLYFSLMLTHAPHHPLHRFTSPPTASTLCLNLLRDKVEILVFFVSKA